MKEPVVVIGMGEMGRVFAGGLLRSGHPVYPLVRSMDLSREATLTPGPEMVLVAVGEKDLDSVLDGLPQSWRDRGIVRPTVVSVWFEKKRGRELRPILPSPVYGPKAGLILAALGSLEIPAVEVAEAAEMLYEMVRKNLYILTTNIAGLVTGGTVGALWREHRALAREVAIEVLDIQEWLVREKLQRDRLLTGMVEAFDADPDHECAGRSARARLSRLIRVADEAGLAAHRIRKIQSELGTS
jgi:hypothetical protein